MSESSSDLPLAKDNVGVGDTVICMIDEWSNGSKDAFDGTVTHVNEKGADVCYLSGYRSRNDLVPWSDVVAKVDLRRKKVRVANGAFYGSFLVFIPDAPKPEETPSNG